MCFFCTIVKALITNIRNTEEAVSMRVTILPKVIILLRPV